MKIIYILLLCYFSLISDSDFKSWIKDGDIKGNLKYYFIETNKIYPNASSTSAYSNAIGGQLSYSTGVWNSIQVNSTFMTAQGFLLPTLIEASTLGQDNIKYKQDHSKHYSLLGEANMEYRNNFLHLSYGRKVVTTPMVGAKEVRLLPSAIEGIIAKATKENISFTFSYIDKFKQRSSNNFINIIQHALGSDTRSIISRNSSYALASTLEYKNKNINYRVYNFYAKDFINTLYADIKFKQNNYSLSAQIVSQKSIGSADKNLDINSSITNGKRINSSGIGLRAQVKYKNSNFDLVYRNIFRDKTAYDSILTPWDGTLLYAYSSTTDNLGQSLYGNGLTAGGAYVGGTEGIKLGFTQNVELYGIKGFKTHVAYAHYINSRYREDQRDLKIFVAYGNKDFSIQLKGIWIDNDTYTLKDTSVKQLDYLTQYHLILNYKF